MAAIVEASPAKRRKISKDSFLDIIEDPHTPLKIKEKASVMPIEVRLCCRTIELGLDYDLCTLMI